MHKYLLHNCRRTILAIALLLGMSAGAWAGHANDRPHLLIMAAVSDDPKSLQGVLQPMAKYMAQKLAPSGIESIEVVVVESRVQMVRMLRDGRVDWITETAYSAALLEQQAGAEILVRKWKHGVADYRSMIFARADSGLTRLADLTGRRIAFQHPGSTTGYFLPMKELQDAGHRLRRMSSLADNPDSQATGFLFSGAGYNTSMWVHKGLVDAGVLSSLDWQDDDILPAGLRDDFRILSTSGPIPRALELVRGDLHPQLKAEIKNVLLNAHLDPDAQEALQAYHGTKKFDELDVDAERALAQIRSLVAANETSLANSR